MDINEKFEEFMAEAPTKRFHQALKKDGSAKIDKRFRAFKSAVDPVRAKKSEEEKERQMQYKIMDEEIQDFLEGVLDDIIESSEELSDESLDEAYKFARKRITASSSTTTKADYDNVKSKVMANAKANLLKKALEALKKYENSDKHAQKSTEYMASDVWKSYGLEKNLGMSTKEFLKKYRSMNEEVEVTEAARPSNEVKDQLANIDMEINRWEKRWKNKSAGNPSDMKAPQAIERLKREKKALMKKHGLKEGVKVNENVMKKIKNVIRGTSEDDLKKQVDKMPQDAVKNWVNSISYKSAKRVLTPSEYIKYTYARNKLGLAENAGCEGTDKLTKKYKKDTPGQ